LNSLNGFHCCNILLVEREAWILLPLLRLISWRDPM
jgi:hypothetical protein